MWARSKGMGNFMSGNNRRAALIQHQTRRSKLAIERVVQRDRFNPGEWVVKDGNGQVLASGFGTDAEANQWINSR